MAPQLKLLIDTNIFIPLEPTAEGDLDSLTPLVTRLASLASAAGCPLLIHPAVRYDISRDKSDARRQLRQTLTAKYPCLPSPPVVSEQLKAVLGAATPGTNDWVDDQLIAALHADAVDFLVTEDREIHRKARRLGLGSRVAPLTEAISILADLFDYAPPPPPAVESLPSHSLNTQDPIFDTFRQDYPDFDSWLRKCKLQHRQAWVVKVAGAADYAAVCIVKPESPCEYGLAGKVLKVCTFKVSPAFNGFRFGELLLKTVFDYVVQNGYDWVYLSVFDKQAALIALLHDFGFEDTSERTLLGETVLSKPMAFREEDQLAQGALAFNIRYGPRAVKLIGVDVFVVPIQPQYHAVLFPEAETQKELFPGYLPFGNSIRKAYLCHAQLRSMPPGSVLLFYRSMDRMAVTVMGVVEETMRSSSVQEVSHYVGKRTVYSLQQIEELCQKEVLVILFRQARVFEQPIKMDELVANKVVAKAPQSIVRVPQEAIEWFRQKVGQ